MSAPIKPKRSRPSQGNRVKRMGLACPHCGGQLSTRSSTLIAPTCRDLYLQCLNPLCSASFTGQLIIVGQISPSAVPNPAVQLRSVPPRRPAAFERTDPGTGPPPPANDPPPLIRQA